MEQTNEKPRRAWQLTLTVGADDRDALVRLLDDFADTVRAGSELAIHGGGDSGGSYSISFDPSWTHERYFAESERFFRRYAAESLPQQISEDRGSLGTQPLLPFDERFANEGGAT